MLSGRNRAQKRFAIICILPAFLVFTLWVAWPTVYAFAFATLRWNGFGDARFVGMANFVNLLSDTEHLLVALKNNLILVFFPTLIALALSLGFAAAIHRGVLGARFFQTVFFFPNILSAVAVTVLWQMLYSTTGYGLINAIRGWLGWSEPYAFTDSSVLIWWVIPVLVWTVVGFFMVLFLAAMQNIPESFYDAARVDGASSIRVFFQITVPLIWDTIVVALVFFAITGLKLFDQVWVFEQQQAKPQSNTIATLLYGRIFNEYRIGEGTAIAVLQFMLVLIVSVVLLRLWRREALEY